MPTLAISPSVKFRSFGIDLYKFNQNWTLPLPPIAGLVGNKNLLDFNDRGVTLIVTLKA